MTNNKKLISFIIYAEKGFFKKPDINDTIYLTYNFIHKPAVLGILGAIIGLKGFEKSNQLPEYYQKLNTIPMGIEPVNSKNGIFSKVVVYYNNSTGFANEGDKKKGLKSFGVTLQIYEQTLLNPSYKIYLLLDMKDEYQERLYYYIRNQQTEYLPYMGKNDYSLWWHENEVQEYEYEKSAVVDDFYIDTIFVKSEALWRSVVEAVGRRALAEQKSWFCTFERLPYKYNEDLFQYDITDFAYTNAKLKRDTSINLENLYKIAQDRVIFLF